MICSVGIRKPGTIYLSSALHVCFCVIVILARECAHVNPRLVSHMTSHPRFLFTRSRETWRARMGIMTKIMA